MKKTVTIFILAISTFLLYAGCTFKSKAIAEPKFGIIDITTYTTDTFRLKVILNNKVLTDSLPSPRGNFSSIVSFFDSTANLLIINTKNNQVILDSVFKLRTGKTSISLVQFIHEQTPYVPQLPNEPPPLPGNYKIRFQYTPFRGDALSGPQDFFYDSVTCIIRKNNVEIDTLVLEKYGLTPFYEGVGNGNTDFSLIIENPVNGDLIDAFIDPIGSNFTGFNTVSVSGKAAFNEWKLIRIY